jgi:hypothetical protein
MDAGVDAADAAGVEVVDTARGVEVVEEAGMRAGRRRRGR